MHSNSTIIPNGILQAATERGKAENTQHVEADFDLEKQIQVREVR